MLITSKSTPKQEPLEEGTYSGYMVWAVALGKQKNYIDEKKIENKVLVAFEIPEFNKEEDGKTVPKLVFKEYTWSANEKSTLAKHALTINRDAVNVGKSIDVAALLGRPIGITLTVSDNGYNRVDSLSKLRESAARAIDPMASECWTFNPFDAKSKTTGIKILGKHIINRIFSAENSDEVVFVDELTDRLNELEAEFQESQKTREETKKAESKTKDKVSKSPKKVEKAEEDEEDLY